MIHIVRHTRRASATHRDHSGPLRFLDASFSERAVRSDPAAVSSHLAFDGDLLLPSSHYDSVGLRITTITRLQIPAPPGPPPPLPARDEAHQRRYTDGGRRDLRAGRLPSLVAPSSPGAGPMPGLLAATWGSLRSRAYYDRNRGPLRTKRDFQHQ